MKKFLAIAVMILGSSLSAVCWNCTGNNIRVQVPTGTVGTGTGDAPGNVVVDSGLTFECEPPTPVTPPTTPSTSNTSNSTSSANSASNSAANSASNSSATGGKATSTATGGNATVGPITNTLANTNTNNLRLSNSQGQKQSQTQANSSVNSNQSAGGSVSNVGNSETIVQRSAPPAMGPTIFPTGCNGSLSGGASAPFGGISIGGTKQDHHCQQMQTAAMFLSQGNVEAATKILCRTWAARDAKLTLDECRLLVKAQVELPIVAPLVTPEPIKVEIINNIPPAPAPIILHEEMTVTASRQDVARAQPQQKKRIVHRPCTVTPIQNSCPTGPQEK